MKFINGPLLVTGTAFIAVLLSPPAASFSVVPTSLSSSHLSTLSLSKSVASTQTKGSAPVTTHAKVCSTQLSAEAIKITMPALSSTMKEGRVVSWLKQEGDAIEAGEAIMVVESDKADMDVEAFEDGYLAKILTNEGESATVGDVVALVSALESEIENVIANYEGTSAASEKTVMPEVVAKTSDSSTTEVEKPNVPFSQIDMPALSSTMKEGKVVSWLKAEGDAVSAGEAIMVVESDKADMDVEAFEDGFLAAIITGEGEVGTVGAPVALLAENEADIPLLQAYAATLSGTVASPPAVSTDKASTVTKSPKVSEVPPIPAIQNGDRIVASPLAKKRAQELGLDISGISGTGPGGRITAGDVEAFASSGAKSATPKKVAPAKTSEASSSWTPAPGVVAATPTARALAKKAKLDISKIKGTGQFGRVTMDDVLIATGQKEPERPKKAPSSAEATELPSGFVPFTGMQRAVSNNMMATLNVPEFRVSREIEMDKFDNLYQKLKSSGVTVSALLAKAVALALEKHPIINSSYDEQAGKPGIRYNGDINIAMAVAIAGGLITPTLKYANERSIQDLGENWKELVGKAKAGSLSPDEYNSGTFTISNMGMFGVTDFGAILPAGTGGILAIGATQEFIVPCSSAVLGMKKVKKMKVTLTCDHRQIYGSDAALFLQTLADIMENQLSKIA